MERLKLGRLGRVAGPILFMVAAASQVVPGTPFNLAGFSEFGGGGLDVSVFSGEIDQARWEQSGVAVAVVGAWHGGSANPYAEATLRNARAAGKVTAIYCYLRPDLIIIWQIDRCKEATGAEWVYLNFVAVDAEAQGLTVGQIVVGLEYVGYLGGRAVLYSGCWFITGYLPKGELGALAAWPYWNAGYTVSGEFEGVMYNGCIPGALLMGEQYAGSGMWGAGQNIWSDKNVFDDVFIRQGYPFLNAATPAPVASAPSGSSLPLIQLQGSPDVWTVLGAIRVHICSPEQFAALGLRWEAVRQVTADDPTWAAFAIWCR